MVLEMAISVLCLSLTLRFIHRVIKRFAVTFKSAMAYLGFCSCNLFCFLQPSIPSRMKQVCRGTKVTTWVYCAQHVFNCRLNLLQLSIRNTTQYIAKCGGGGAGFYEMFREVLLSITVEYSLIPHSFSFSPCVVFHLHAVLLSTN